MQLNKPIAAVVIVVLLGLGSIVLIFGGTLAGSLSSHGAMTTTSLNHSQVSSTSISSGNGSGSVEMGMNVLPTIRLVPLGGSANFTVILYNGGDFTGGYSLSATAPPGLSFRFGAVPVDISGAGPHSGKLVINSSSETSPGTYQVMIVATGSKGTANQTFDFHVQRNLVLLSAITNGPIFSNLTVKAGDAVTWVSLDGAIGDDDVNLDFHQIIFSANNMTSGPLQQYESWSRTFTQPGVYRYHDNIMSSFPIGGEVIVLP